MSAATLSHRNRRTAAALALVALLSAGQAVADARPAPAGNVEIYFGDAPPLTMQQSTATPGDSRGIIGDVVMEAARRAGYAVIANAIPWARAQNEVREGTDRLIIPLTRTPAREAHYTWISEVMLVGLAFATTGPRVSSYQEANATLRRVGFLRGSIGQQVLPRQGFPAESLAPLSSYDTELELLQRGRIDGWFDSIPVMKWIVRQHPALKNIVIGPPVEEAGVYLACSKTCSPRLVAAFRTAIADIHADGTYQRMMIKYLGDQPAAPVAPDKTNPVALYCQVP